MGMGYSECLEYQILDEHLVGKSKSPTGTYNKFREK
jgi:hypothetical protein